MFGLTNTQSSFSWRSYLRSPLYFVPLFFAVIANLAQWVIASWEFSAVQGFLVIRYSVYIGPTWLAPWYYILSLPLLGLAVVLVDFMVGYFLGKYSLLFRQIILWVGLVLNLILLWLLYLLIIFNS